MSIPEGATHVVADIYSLRDEQKAMNNKYPYRKKDGDLWMAFVDDEWVNVWLPDPKRYQKIDKPWSGPEDGLPPVGEIVEYNGYSLDLKPGSRVEIIHHFNAGVADAAAFLYYKSGGRYVSQAIASYFKPACNAATIAADQRETAIRELMDIAQVDCRVTAARLVDAGFKREVV